jgi:hypothetical protein
MYTSWISTSTNILPESLDLPKYSCDGNDFLLFIYTSGNLASGKVVCH